MGFLTVSLVVGTLIHCFDWERVRQELVNIGQGFGISLTKSRPLEAVSYPRHAMCDISALL